MLLSFSYQLTSLVGPYVGCIQHDVLMNFVLPKIIQFTAPSFYILRREANWIGHILRRNCLLHDAIEELITEVKGIRIRITQLLDGLINRRKYLELKEEAEDRKRRKLQFIDRE